MSRQSFVVVCVCWLMAGVAQAQVKFERKLAENSTTVVETTVKLEQKLKIAGMDQDTATENRRVVRATSGKRDGLGRLKVEEKIEELNVSITAPNAEYQFDSKNPDAAGASPLEAVRPLHKALAQQSVTLVHDKDNALAEVEFDQQFINGLDANVQMMVKDQLDPAAMKKQAKQKVAQLPSDAVQRGDTWERSESMNLGAGQMMTFHSKYKYEGPVDHNGKTVDKITFEIVGVDFGLENSPLPLKVTGSNLKPEKSGGVILFDRALGNIVDESETARVTGTIDFEVNAQKLPAELDLKIEIKVNRKK